MGLTIFFWVTLTATGFAFALALQMRIMLGVVVARALRARDETLEIPASRLAMVRAGNGETGAAAVDHIHATYPEQVRQLRLARRVTAIAPILLFGILVLGRATGRI